LALKIGGPRFNENRENIRFLGKNKKKNSKEIEQIETVSYLIFFYLSLGFLFIAQFSDLCISFFFSKTICYSKMLDFFNLSFGFPFYH
jgi:hypothetical protein